MSQPRYMQLDPIRDHETIVKWMVVDTWKFDLARATELALLKTFAFPEIAKVLVDTQEILSRSQQRYDNKDPPLALFIENGYSSSFGIRALQQLNHMHAIYPIANHHMLYVLATLVIEPICWIETYGWRPLLMLEKKALFYFWIQVGRRMDIKDLFPNLDAMLVYHQSYEAERMRFSQSNVCLYRSALSYIAKILPFPLGLLAPWALPAIISPQMCASFHLKPKGQLWRSLIQNALKLRAHGSQLLPSRPQFRSQTKRGSHPDGYTFDPFSVDTAPLSPAKRRSEA